MRDVENFDENGGNTNEKTHDPPKTISKEVLLALRIENKNSKHFKSAIGMSSDKLHKRGTSVAAFINDIYVPIDIVAR